MIRSMASMPPLAGSRSSRTAPGWCSTTAASASSAVQTSAATTKPGADSRPRSVRVRLRLSPTTTTTSGGAVSPVPGTVAPGCCPVIDMCADRHLPQHLGRRANATPSISPSSDRGRHLRLRGRARIARSCRRRRCTLRSWTGTPGTRATCPGARPGTSAWAVLVSEVMLQQTPVARVEPVYRAWLERWPTPAALAAEPPGEAVRAWGRLGYPRRALRLHAAATEVVARHGGELPTTYDGLRRAARGRGVHRRGRRVVRVRRPARRAGHQRAPGAGPGGRRRRAAGAHAHGRRAGARRGGACPTTRPPRPAGRSRVMELGALVCTARAPRLRPVPGGRPVRVAAGGLPGVRRAGAAQPRPSPAPTGRSAGC